MANTSGTGSGMSGTTTSGMGAGTSATASGSVETDETRDLIASNKVEGTAVYNREGERLGTVYNFMVNKVTGQVAYAVMSFGGFLGLGQSYHPLPWRLLTYNTKVGGYVVDLDKERLQDAPSYSDSESSAWTRTYGKSIDAYYERPDRPRHEEAVDATVDDSFPASDPPAWTSETGAGKPKEP
jgi:sporulation protein YlmC with PRC-barrel domain